MDRLFLYSSEVFNLQIFNYIKPNYKHYIVFVKTLTKL